jgi:outer membrane protein TolC
LLPSNWFQLNVRKDLREAEVAGMKSLALNTVLGAERSYFTVLRDQELQILLTNYKANIVEVGRRYEVRTTKHRVIDPVGVNYIRGKVRSIESALLSSQQLVDIEKAALNRMITQRTETSLLKMHMAPSSLESLSSTELMNHLATEVSVSPEMQQIHWLIEASKNSKWASVFAFLNSASVGTSINSSGFGNLSGTGSMNLGLGILPLFSLGDHQVGEFEYQKRELSEEAWRIIQTLSATIQSTKQQILLLEDASVSYEESFRLLMARMDRGEGDYGSPLGSLELSLEARIQLIDARLSLDSARLNMNRLMRMDLFQNVAFQTPKP